MTLLIGVLGGIIVLIIGAISPVAWRRTSESRRRVRMAANMRKQGAAGLSKPVPSAILSDLFTVSGLEESETLDAVILECNLRPDIPLIDFMYLDYLRRRLELGTVGTVILVPWSGGPTNPVADVPGEEAFKANISLMFGSKFDDSGVDSAVLVLGARELAPYAAELASEEFLNSLRTLENSSFLEECSTAMGYRFRSLSDVGSGTSAKFEIRNLIRHIVRGRLVLAYIKEQRAELLNDARLGAILWERELPKLLLVANLTGQGQARNRSLILGKSITCRRFLSRRSIPVDDSSACKVFGTEDELWEYCKTRSKRQLKQITKLARALLTAGPVPTGGPLPHRDGPMHQVEAFQAILQLQAAYPVRGNHGP